jgi:hypothetical protein
MEGQEPVIEQVVETPVVETKVPEVTIPKEKIDEVQKKAYGYAFGQVDQRLAELGYDKPDGVKTTDFLVELLTKQKNETPSGTKEPIEKVDNTELGTKVKELQNLLREKEGELEKVRSSVSTQKRDYWVDSLVNSTPIAIPDHLSEQEKERMITRTKSLMKSELLNNFDVKEVNGKFSFYSKEGSPILDGTIDMNPISPQSLIEREFSEFLKVKQAAKEVVKGTGTTIEEGKEPVERVIPSKVKNHSEFYEYLRVELGLTMGSKEFMEKIALAKKERPSMFN